MSFSGRMSLNVFFVSMIFLSAVRSEAIETFAGLASGVLFEKGNDSVTEVTRLPLGFSVGLARAPWRTRIEYSSFRTADGNATVSVAREVESVMSWVSFSSNPDVSWMPEYAIGVGVVRTNVETTLNQSIELSRGSWAGAFSLALGLQGRWTKRLMVRPELRYDSAQNFKTKDARWGAFVNLELSIF